jgi:hypothetical protein
VGNEEDEEGTGSRSTHPGGQARSG